MTMEEAKIRQSRLLRDEDSGSSSVPKLIQTNKDLRLTLTEKVHLGEEEEFKWKTGKNNIAQLYHGKVTIYKDYKGRVEFSREDLSLVLKNVSPSDNGTYTAVVSGDQDVTHATYNVTVQALGPGGTAHDVGVTVGGTVGGTVGVGVTGIVAWIVGVIVGGIVLILGYFGLRRRQENQKKNKENDSAGSMLSIDDV